MPLQRAMLGAALLPYRAVCRICVNKLLTSAGQIIR